MLSGTQTLARYTDPTSEKQIAFEIRNLMERLQNAMYRSLASRRDFSLRIYGTEATQTVRLRWQDGSEESWKLDNIAVQNMAASGSAILAGSQYSSRFHTLTPATTLRIYTVGEASRPQRTAWRIAISAYGLVTLQRD